LKKIVFFINLDMMGRTASSSDSSRTHIVFYSDEGVDAVKKRIEKVNRNTIQWTLEFRPAGNIQSDYIHFMNRDIPTALFFSGYHADYHQPSDVADKIDYEKLLAMTRLVYALVQDTGNETDGLFADTVRR
jgi:Zn-dependent M28 family amino/carboxypeptidase